MCTCMHAYTCAHALPSKNSYYMMEIDGAIGHGIFNVHWRTYSIPCSTGTEIDTTFILISLETLCMYNAWGYSKTLQLKLPYSMSSNDFIITELLVSTCNITYQWGLWAEAIVSPVDAWPSVKSQGWCCRAAAWCEWYHTLLKRRSCWERGCVRPLTDMSCCPASVAR